MLPRTERHLFVGTDNQTLFGPNRTRAILARAAREQHRRNRERAESYSLEELEEMAAEAGISREALQSAISGPQQLPRTVRRWLPRGWSARASTIALISGGAIVLLALMIAFPVIAYTILWLMILMMVLMLLGASPF